MNMPNPPRQSRGYQLGKKVQELSFAMRMNLPQIHARPFLKRLVEQTGESAHLAILIQGQALVIEDVETLETLRVDSGIGRFCPPHCTAIGKSLLAFNPLPLPQTLDRYTDKTILDKYELRQHMEQVRQQGYAVDDEEYTVGVRCLAAPVFDDSYGAVATIGISGPTVRVTHERVPEIATYVKQAAQALSITLDYTPTPV